MRGVLGERVDAASRCTWITSTDESRTRSTPVDRRDRAHQVAELEAALGIAVAADRDPGHHHLGLALLDAAARPPQHGARGARAGARRAPSG